MSVRGESICLLCRTQSIFQQDVLMALQGCLRGNCLKFGGCFKEVFKDISRKLRVFTENFKGVSKKFKGCFVEVSRVFQGFS